MSNRINKTPFVVIAFSLIISAFLFFLFTPQVKAQTAESLQEQIQALLQQISAIQAQIKEFEGSPKEPPGAIISTFARNLRFGDRGSEVKNLQKALNQDPLTRIAQFGYGSPGQETDFFGTLTKAAVVVFQEKYASEVLVPVGLLRGTGFVGPSTRAKLDQLQKLQQTMPSSDDKEGHSQDSQESPVEIFETEIFETTSEESTSGALGQEVSIFDLGGDIGANLGAPFPVDSLLVFDPGNTGGLFVAFPSSYNGVTGDKIVLSGSGFSAEGNIVHFGEASIENIPSPTGADLTFIVPELPAGNYTFFVSNENGLSNSTNFSIFSVDTVPPAIGTLFPVSGVGKTSVTISGSGFSKISNRVYVGYDVLENIPSADGKTITVSIFPPNESGQRDEVEFFAMGAETTSMAADLITDLPEELWIYVENENGISNAFIYKYFYDKTSF